MYQEGDFCQSRDRKGVVVSEKVEVGPLPNPGSPGRFGKEFLCLWFELGGVDDQHVDDGGCEHG